MELLTFQNIMDADDITEKEVEVPEWGGKVKVRSISHRQMQKIKNKADNIEEVDDDFVEKGILLHGLIEPKLDEDQIEMIWDKSTQAIMKILNGILGASKTDEKAVTQEEKSLPAPTE